MLILEKKVRAVTVNLTSSDWGTGKWTQREQKQLKTDIPALYLCLKKQGRPRFSQKYLLQ